MICKRLVKRLRRKWDSLQVSEELSSFLYLKRMNSFEPFHRPLLLTLALIRKNIKSITLKMSIISSEFFDTLILTGWRIKDIKFKECQLGNDVFAKMNRI